jgi:hypothetical protein
MIKTAIETFVSALNSTWGGVSRLQEASTQQGLVADWAQASWESIVEAALSAGEIPLRLVVYGDGADIYGASSRFSDPEAEATHEVRCRPIGNEAVDHLSEMPIADKPDGYTLDRFVTLRGQWYEEAPPFDFALVTYDETEFVVPISALEWDVAEVRDRDGEIPSSLR